MSVSSTGRGPSAAEDDDEVEGAGLEVDEAPAIPLEVEEAEGAAPLSPSSSSSRSGGGERAFSHPISPEVYLCEPITKSVGSQFS